MKHNYSKIDCQGMLPSVSSFATLLRNLALNMNSRFLFTLCMASIFFLSFTSNSVGNNADVKSPNVNWPYVTLTSPADGIAYLAGTTVSFAANAYATQGSVVKVEFIVYQGNTTLTTLTDYTAPYTASYTFNSVGNNYGVYARVTDTQSNWNVSTGAKIIITNGTPVVSITSPSNFSSFLAPANVTISANAQDPGGSVNRVEFYITPQAGATGPGGTFIDYSSPYSIVWPTSAIGTYSVWARVYDNTGATDISYNTTNVTITSNVQVWFKKPASYTAAKAYYWNVTPAKPSIAWPGDAMFADTYKGANWYVYTIYNATKANFVFTDGTGHQTADLLNVTGGCYDGNTSQWVNCASARLEADEDKETNSESAAWNMFPNPASESVNIKYNGAASKSIEVKIYDVLGHEVYKDIIPAADGGFSKSISTINFKAGIYNVLVNDGVKTSNRTLTVQ